VPNVAFSLFVSRAGGAGQFQDLDRQGRGGKNLLYLLFMQLQSETEERCGQARREKAHEFEHSLSLLLLYSVEQNGA
jgi:hypothetical protein